MTSAAEELRAIEPYELDRPEDAQSRIGQVVAGIYRIMRYLGSGGSSYVYEVEHVRLARPFALKLLRPELTVHCKTAQRFRREANAIARVNSEHVVSVIDCGELADRTPYLVMELLQGEDLRSLLRRERQLPVRRALNIALEACRGLVAMHEVGLVHRDLKPENLFITRRCTGEDWCKVLDFGVVKTDESQSTAQGAIIGTVRYMAPEQLTDGAAAGPAADIYAIGAILHECLAGTPLVGGASVQEAMYRVMNVEPRTLMALRPELPIAVSQLVESCVAKAASNRPNSSTDLEKAIRGLLDPESSEPTERTHSEDSHAAIAISAKPVPRLRSWGSLALPPAALVFAATIGWLWRGPSTAAGAVSLHGRNEPGLTLDGSQEMVQLRGARSSSPSPPIAESPPPPTAKIAGIAQAATPASSVIVSHVRPLAPPKPQPELKPVPASSAAAPSPATVGHFDASNPYE